MDDSKFFSIDFLSNFFQINIEIDIPSMQINITREKDFPNIRKIRASISRNKKGITTIITDPISSYKMDNRWFSMPTMDLSLGKSWNKSQNTHSSTDNYNMSLGGIIGGFDINAYLSGSFSSEASSTKRIRASRILLDDNLVNLKDIKIGDIGSVSSSFFNTSSSGRGIQLSSFKNLVMSADKTIDISGPLADGWEVELYWNDQLVGYRQSAKSGEYLFSNIPVSFGLNTFKIVFYGPYGEIKTEEKRYYSGTSPVKNGEIGYNMSIYQPDKYIFNDDIANTSNVPIIDMNLYYGLTDNNTLMLGGTQTQNPEDKTKKVLFSMMGLQTLINGTSLQYNLTKNNDTNKIAHHLEWEGDVYIGSLLMKYDYFGKLHSPLAYNGSSYLKEQAETRLSGILPFAVLYYISYTQGKEENTKKYNTTSLRLSKQVSKNHNVVLEDLNTKKEESKTNSWHLGWFYWKDKITTETWLNYQTEPNQKLEEGSLRLNWRADRYTYYSTKYVHNFNEHTDTFDFSAGHNFSWGGITFSFQTDKKFKNITSTVNYTIGFGPTIDNKGLFHSTTSKLSETGTIYAKLTDENNNPLKDVGLNANNLNKMVYTDENGEAVLTDLETYEKTIFTIDSETVEDLSLKPKMNNLKLILRPGAINYLQIPFEHYASIEGQIPNPKNKVMFGNRIAVLDNNGTEIASSYSDISGYFIVENVPYGTYDVIIEKDNKVLHKISKVKVDDFMVYIPIN